MFYSVVASVNVQLLSIRINMLLKKVTTLRSELERQDFFYLTSAASCIYRAAVCISAKPEASRLEEVFKKACDNYKI